MLQHLIREAALLGGLLLLKNRNRGATQIKIGADRAGPLLGVISERRTPRARQTWHPHASQRLGIG
jgi:hypothetical protein